MNLLVKNVRWHSRGDNGYGDIRVSHGRIRAISSGLSQRRGEHALDMSGHTALPGLINAHDHLSLNLFPRCGNPPYTNFYEWAQDAYRPDDEMQREIMSVSLRDRLLWGGYKNLIAGATTVVHHDQYARSVFNRHFPVDVLRGYGWTHSLGFGRNVAWQARWSKVLGRPFVIHAAEGTDEKASREIDVLHLRGILDTNTVVVHGLALESRHIDLMARAGCSVVWCPASNRFLYHASAPVAELRRSGVPVALGTDSTLSGAPTLLHEIRLAHESGLATAEELLAMVSADAARMFNLTDGRGELREGGRADVTILPDASGSPAEALLAGVPSLVLSRGRVRLAERRFAERLELEPSKSMIGGRSAWLYGDLWGLTRRIAARVGSGTLEQNPLWNMLANARSEVAVA